MDGVLRQGLRVGHDRRRRRTGRLFANADLFTVWRQTEPVLCALAAHDRPHAGDAAQRDGRQGATPPQVETASRSHRTKPPDRAGRRGRSEEHTSELQSLMRISYAVFCLKQKKTTKY